MTYPRAEALPGPSTGLSRGRAHLEMLLVVAAPVVVVIGVAPLLEDGVGTLVGLAALWLLAGVAVGLAMRGPGGAALIGWRRVSRRDVLLGIGLGIGLMLLVPLLSMLAGALLPTEGGEIADAAASPWPIVLLAIVTAAVTEEVLFRGFPIGRSKTATRSVWWGSVLGLVGFVVIHAGGWSLAHVVGVVLPLGVLLTLIYLWRRTLIVVMIAHFITDLPLLVIAIAS